MLLRKSTTASELLVKKGSRGVQISVLLASCDSNNTVLFRDENNNIIFVLRIASRRTVGFVENFPVIKINSDVFVSTSSSNLTDIYWESI